MMNKKGLICIDWDGTILRSDDMITDCLQRTLQNLNLPVPNNSTLSTLVGASEATIMDTCLHDNCQHRDTFWPLFRTLYNQNLLELALGAEDFLIRHQHFNIAIVSNKNSISLNEEIQHFNIMQLIDKVYTADCYVAKPNPEMITQAMAHYDTPSGLTWMIGDSMADAEAASLAQVEYIPVNASHWREGSLSFEDINLRLV